MVEIIPYRDAHRTEMIEVVRAVHREYNFAWDEAGYHRDLYDVPGHYLGDKGMFWLAMDDEHDAKSVIGCAGVTLHGEQSELHRLYLAMSHRGRGLGRRLLETTMAYSSSKGCRRMFAWSDVLLEDAHRLYLRTGFRQEGQRICNDPDQALELGFWRELP